MAGGAQLTEPRERPPASRARPLLVAAVASAVAVAFADSSIVVLALPDLYAQFDTTIQGIAWVITSYNVAVAVVALLLVPVARRFPARSVMAVGSAAFLGASIACAVADSLPVLVVARSVQGVGAALLLSGALLVLGALTGSALRGIAIWTAAGTIGAALGPVLGGVLTQAFDWRAIFVVQAPIAGVALLAAFAAASRALEDREAATSLRTTMPANLCLGLVFGALVGALFLGVLLVIDVFGRSPIEGAAIVSAIPVAAIAARPLADRLSLVLAATGGGVLLAGGLAGLALVPSDAAGYAVASFALCGVGLGLSVPGLTEAVMGDGHDLGRRGTLTVGVRHAGLVLALAVVAPILSADLEGAAEVAMLNGTAVILDGRIPATTKIPLALDIRDVLERAPEGAIPDLSEPFEAHGAATDPAVAQMESDLHTAIVAAVARGFRGSFLFCALLASLAAALALVLRRRLAA